MKTWGSLNKTDGSGFLKRSSGVLLFALVIVAATAVCAIAAEGGEEVTTMDWVWRIVNFAIIMGVLVYFLRKPMKDFFSKRVTDIEAALAEARAAKEEALKKLAEVQARLKDKDAEISSLVKMAEENGRKERELLAKEGDRMSEDIASSAKENIDAELLKAREALRREASLLAVEMAEKLVRENIKKEDQDRIVEEYISKVGSR